MVLIRFRTLQKNYYKIEIDNKDKILQAKEKLSQEAKIAYPNQIKLLFKAKVLKDDQTIESLNIAENDFILAHFPPENPKNKCGPKAIHKDSIEAYKLLRYFIPLYSPNGVSILDQVFQRVIQKYPIALENVIEFMECTRRPNAREEVEDIVYELGLDPTILQIESVKNRLSPSISDELFKETYKQIWHDLNIKIDVSVYENVKLYKSPPPPKVPGFGPPPGQVISGYQKYLFDFTKDLTPEEIKSVKRICQLFSTSIEIATQYFISNDKDEKKTIDYFIKNKPLGE